MKSFAMHGHARLPRVCIIGAGIVGTATAFFLAQSSCDVTIFERGTVGGQASGVNFGGVRCHGRDPSELPLAMRSRTIWNRLAELIGHDCDFEAPGHLKIARSPAEMDTLTRWFDIGRAHDLDVELLDRTQLMRRFPWLASDIVGASLCKGDGFANPRLVAPTFARAARALGASVQEGSAVTGIDRLPGGGFRVSGANFNALEADVVVNAAGAWAASLGLPFGAAVPTVTRAPQMFVTEPTTRFIGPVLGLASGDIYLRQSVRGNVIFGGGQGHIDPGGIRSHPDETTFARTPALMRNLIPALAHTALLRSWTGLEANTPDGLPVIGTSAGHDGFIHAYGFSGHGFATGPGLGETLSELILRGQTRIDLTSFHPDRFAAIARPAAL